MTKQRLPLIADWPLESWNEDCTRARKLKEALHKQHETKQARCAADGLKKKTAVGRLRIEP